MKTRTRLDDSLGQMARRISKSTTQTTGAGTDATRSLSSAPEGLVKVSRALVSVSDKSGLAELVMALKARGVEIVSTGGTAAAIAKMGVPVTPIDKVTGFPEIMDGRVKTLHPKVHGGLLGVRDNKEHAKAMLEHGIAGIDLVVVNLYPFEQTVAKEGVSRDEAIENIDIGGPSMLRSAAKNHEWVTVVTSPADYSRVIGDLETHNGCTSRELRRELAAEVFKLTSRYDAAIAGYLTRAQGEGGHATSREFAPVLTLSYAKSEDLRYGENPHQAAAVYTSLEQGPRPLSVVGAPQLHGKTLSYNNVQDATAALELARALAMLRHGQERPGIGACVVKHTNPCGASLALTCADAVDEAIMGDPLAAYGGILAVSAELDGPAAARLCRNDVFLEVIVAPSYSETALSQLKGRWANLRLLAVGPLVPEGADAAGAPQAGEQARELRYTFVPGGLLVQEADRRQARKGEIEHKAGPAPTLETLEIVSFLEAVCRALTSNAIAIGGVSPQRGEGTFRLFGAGAGQMDRVNACKIAAQKARKLALGAVAFSDAFFPFSDGPKALIKAGVTTIAHPGGSKRDQDTFDLCKEHRVTCLTTGLRHFRH